MCLRLSHGLYSFRKQNHYRSSITKMLTGKSYAPLIGYFKYTCCTPTQTNLIIAERFNQ